MVTDTHVARGRKDRPRNDRAVRRDHEGEAHPEQGFRSCLGIISLVRTYGAERVEAANRRGNNIRATTYGSIKSILQNGLDRAFAEPGTPDASPIRHANIRGRGYYH